MVAGNIFGGGANVSPAPSKSGVIKVGQSAPSQLAGRIGSAYINTDTGEFYIRRQHGTINNWGNPIFTLPASIRALTRFYGECEPNPSIGDIGEYYLQVGGTSAGAVPALYGPKAADNTWPLNTTELAGVDMNPSANWEINE